MGTHNWTEPCPDCGQEAGHCLETGTGEYSVYCPICKEQKVDLPPFNKHFLKLQKEWSGKPWLRLGLKSEEEYCDFVSIKGQLAKI